MSKAPPSALGEFEVVILLAVLRLTERSEPAYGSTIRDEIAARANRAVARGAVYVTLDRLEHKGLLKSRVGEASGLRDGRPKRLFSVTAPGLASVRRAVALVNRLQHGLQLVRETE